VRRVSNSLTDPAYQAGGVVLLLALGVILAALGFEVQGGHVPCPLCLQQRFAYYIGVPATFVALVLLASGQAVAARWLFLAVALVFLANAGLGAYHAGAEWKFWEGPSTCDAPAGGVATNASDLLKGLGTTRVARCDSPGWWFLGLSFAGWNAVMSFILSAGAVQAALAATRGR
jgi:disulfide bond formation protein DsbB